MVLNENVAESSDTSIVDFAVIIPYFLVFLLNIYSLAWKTWFYVWIPQWNSREWSIL